jgi:hypothetical protein
MSNTGLRTGQIREKGVKGSMKDKGTTSLPKGSGKVINSTLGKGSGETKGSKSNRGGARG